MPDQDERPIPSSGPQEDAMKPGRPHDPRQHSRQGWDAQDGDPTAPERKAEERERDEELRKQANTSINEEIKKTFD